MTPKSNSRTPGELTRRTQNAPKLLAARASPQLPRTQLGELTALPRPPAGGEKPHPQLSPSGFEFRPRNVDFVPTPMNTYCASRRKSDVGTNYYHSIRNTLRMLCYYIQLSRVSLYKSLTAANNVNGLVDKRHAYAVTSIYSCR